MVDGVFASCVFFLFLLRLLLLSSLNFSGIFTCILMARLLFIHILTGIGSILSFSSILRKATQSVFIVSENDFILLASSRVFLV